MAWGIEGVDCLLVEVLLALARRRLVLLGGGEDIWTRTIQAGSCGSWAKHGEQVEERILNPTRQVRTRHMTFDKEGARCKVHEVQLDVDREGVHTCLCLQESQWRGMISVVRKLKQLGRLVVLGRVRMERRIKEQSV